jgi:hypothetical protein
MAERRLDLMAYDLSGSGGPIGAAPDNMTTLDDLDGRRGRGR